MGKEITDRIRDNFLVYQWFHKDQLYYVGMGTLSRACNMKEGARNDRWWEITSKYNNNEILTPVIDGKLYKAGDIYLWIVQDNMNEGDCLALEGKLIARYGRKGIDEGGILTNLQIGHGKGEHREDRYCTPINQYTLEGKYVASYRDSTSVYIPGEKLLIGLCISKNPNGTYKQQSTGGYIWRAQNDPNINGTDDLKDINIQNKGGNTTSRKYYKTIDNQYVSGQRKLGFALGGIDLMRRYEAGIKNLPQNMIDEAASLEISKSEFNSWKKANKEEYKAWNENFRTKYKEYKKNKGRNYV